MKLLMLCGSPRPKGNSMYLLGALQHKLSPGNEIVTCSVSDGPAKAAEQIVKELPACDALIAAFPLYVDGIPSNFLGVLRAIELAKPLANATLRAYAIVNNGFYDAAQNGIATELFWNWCAACNLQKGRALGVGAGEMVQMAPPGHGPSANLGKALDQFAADILHGNSGETVFVEPNFPRFLYKIAAHFGWRRQAKQNGLNSRDLFTKEH